MTTTAENKALLQKIYAETSKGNIRALLDKLAEDISWTIIGNTVLSGTFNGKREVIDKLLKPLGERLGSGPIVFHPDRFVAEGEYVVMQARGQATARSSHSSSNET